jgi:hypothetical protein
MNVHEESRIQHASPSAKDRYSDITCASEQDRTSEYVASETPALASDSNYRLELFELTVEASEISQKMHQRAVSWMITVCWSKNLSQDCLWSTLLLFYVYKAKLRTPKEELELIRNSFPTQFSAASASRSSSTAAAPTLPNNWPRSPVGPSPLPTSSSRRPPCSSWSTTTWLSPTAWRLFAWATAWARRRPRRQCCSASC